MEFGYMEAQWAYAITSFFWIYGGQKTQKRKQKHSGEANSQNLGYVSHITFSFYSKKKSISFIS